MKYTAPTQAHMWRHPMPTERENPPLSTTGYALPARYGNRKVPEMIDEINAMRAAIRAEGTPAIQDALDRVEPYIDFLFQEAARNG